MSMKRSHFTRIQEFTALCAITSGFESIAPIEDPRIKALAGKAYKLCKEIGEEMGELSRSGVLDIEEDEQCH